MSTDVAAFKGRVAIVTGGSGGIGSAVCAALRDRGSVAVSLARERSREAALSIECDVSDEEQVNDAFSRVEEEHGPATILVCAAGVLSEQEIEHLGITEWRRVIDASLTGTFLAARRAVPGMRKAHEGRIVALSSGYARRGYKGGAHYAAAKAGVEALVKSLALEVANSDITVNAIAPGPVDTPMIGHKADPEGWRRMITSVIPMGRIAAPDDVVGPILFLLGPDSGYITGQILHVNGGMLMP